MSNIARLFCFSRAAVSSIRSSMLNSIPSSITQSTRLIIATALMFPALAYAAASGIESGQPVQTTPHKQERILVYGDSLSAAYGLNPADGWVSLMAKQLKSRGVEVINASVSGETSIGGAARIKADLALQKPTIVLLALGANDGLRGLPVAAMQKNLEAITVASLKAGARVIMVGMQIPPNYGIEYTQHFSAAYSTLATRYKLLLIPFLLEGIADKLELFQADRLHPAAIAQPRILQNVMPTIEQILKKNNQSPQKAKP